MSAAPADAGAALVLVCPAWEQDLTLSCSQQEVRGRWHDGCAIDGRRPKGLIAARPREREVADYLSRSAHLEAASVIAFETLAEELVALGAPRKLVEDCRQAAREEIAHAQVVTRLARARGAEPPKVELGPRTVPSRLELALENVAEGVVREAYGAVQAIVRGRTAAAADVRRAMVSIAMEEASHAALSLRVAAWLAEALSEAELREVARAKEAAIEELRCELDDEPTAALRSELGLPSRELALRLVDDLKATLWRTEPDGLTA